MDSGKHKIEKSTLENIDECSDEQIHLIGTLQDFAFLLGFRKDNQKLTFYSDQVTEKSGLTEDGLFDFFWSDFLVLLKLDRNARHWESLLKGDTLEPLHFNVNSAHYNVYLNSVDNFVLAEFEEVETVNETSRFYDQTEHFVKSVNRSSSLQEFAQLFSKQIKDLTEYDRVMVYRFDKDNNGEVIAESKNKDLSPFLGLHYPHTDIPVQARELYKRKVLRVLADVDAADQRIYSVDQKLKASDIDLSLCISRSVSPIHLEYLRNMGVTATLTISILIDKQLWGLVSCHHHSPKYLGHMKRREAKLQTSLFASLIRRWEAAEEYKRVQEKEHIYQSILEEIVKGNDKFEATTSTSYFTGLTESDGGVVIREGSIYAFGETPSNDKIFAIQKWMQNRNERVFLTNEFSKHTELANDILDVASGVLYYSFDEAKESAMIWFRKELSKGVKWGGRILNSRSLSNLTPRRSFEAWEEKMTGKSATWDSHQIQAGLRLGAFLEKEVFISELKDQKQQLESLTDQLTSKNEELSQFNWIASHDMKEPLRKIRLFIDQIRLEEDRLSEDQLNYFERLNKSAFRMQELINDILEYTKLSKEEAFRKEDLSIVIEELREHYSTGEVAFELVDKDLPNMEMVRFQIKQLFANLISNSIKFRKDNQAVHIDIIKSEVSKNEIEEFHLSPDLKYFKITYSDNGIGFEEDYNERVFEVFQRLHTQKKFEGTGIGLSICKKVVDSHKGEITAEGRKGLGVKFTILLPQHQNAD
jgi:light-regulated signal transduction histidine kinase (bacteriophytochrome)